MKFCVSNIIIIILFLYVQSLFSQAAIKGGYKSWTMYSYNFKDGILDLSSKLKKEYRKFDEKNNIIELTRFSDDSLIPLYSFINDTVEHLLISINFNNNGTIKEKYITENDVNKDIHYTIKIDSLRNIDTISSDETDSNYNLYQKITFKKNSMKQKVIYQRKMNKYDNQGNLTDETWYNSSDSIIYVEKFRFEYDSLGRMEEAKFNSFGIIPEEIVNNYKCDYKGNEQIIYPTNRQRCDSFNIFYRYDLNGDTSEVVHYDPICIREKYVYKYNNRKLIEHIRYNQKDSIIGHCYWNYNDKDSLISVTNFYKGNKSKTIFGYMNWNDLSDNYTDEYNEYYLFLIDSHGNILIRTNIYKNDYKKIFDKHEYYYDSFGNVIEEIYFDDNIIPYQKNEFIYSK